MHPTVAVGVVRQLEDMIGTGIETGIVIWIETGTEVEVLTGTPGYEIDGDHQNETETIATGLAAETDSVTVI